MIRFRALPAILFCVATATLQTACEKRPDFGAKPGPDGKIPESWHFVGEPDPAKVWKPATATTDFKTLYTQNCIACHGSGATVGPVIALDNPTLLNILPADKLADIITHGVKGTLMAPFGISEGGNLTKEQVDILVKGILANKKPPMAGMPPLPAFSGPLGNAESGHAIFNLSCALCHGMDGKNGVIAGSPIEPAYLGLVSDQYLRSIVIAGRPDLGMPVSTVKGKPLSDQEVSDVVAWLVSNRKNEYGEPLQAVAPSPTPISDTPAAAPAPSAPVAQ